MKKRVKCEEKNCKDHFYADEEEDKLKNQYFCSYCMPYMRTCVVCKELYKGKKTNQEDGVCSICREKYKIVALNGFVNLWYILRFKVFTRDKFTCRYCGRSPLEDIEVKLHCDHIVPSSKGGTDELENLVTSCKECNLGKMDVVLDKENEIKIMTRKIYENS